MTPQELKNSILQLAIQGKLVDQRPEDGTAEELFARLREETQQLIKEGKIKKEKPLPEITEDEKPFEIPESWMWCRHNELFEIVGGSQPPKAKFSDTPMEGYVRLYQIRDYGEKPVPVYVPKNLVSKFSADGDILLARYGGSLGKVFIAKAGAYNVAMAKVKFLFERDYILKPYLYYYYLAPLYQKLVRNNSRSAQAGFNKDDLNNLMFPLPPLAEQKRIVAKIEELLPYIDRYEQAWSKLEQFNSRFPEDMKKSLLQHAIQGKLVEQRPEEGTAEELFAQIQEEKQRLIKAGKIKKQKPLPAITEDEKPFEIPESWKWVRVQEIICLNPKNDLPDELEVSFIPMALIDDDYHNSHSFEIRTWSGIKKGFTHFADGDIGIAKITPCFQNRKSVIFRNLKNGYGAGTTELSIVRVINDLLSRDFLLWFFKSAYFIDNGVKSFTGTAGQQRIHKDYLAKCVLPLPPLAEQKRIVEKLEQLLPLCERLK